MLKRCAVVLGTAVACILATSPIAFAAPGDALPPQSDDHQASNDQSGLVAVGDVNLLNGANVCPNITALIPLGSLLGILGPGTASATSGDSIITCTTSVRGKHVGPSTGDESSTATSNPGSDSGANNADAPTGPNAGTAAPPTSGTGTAGAAAAGAAGPASGTLGATAGLPGVGG